MSTDTSSNDSDSRDTSAEPFDAWFAREMAELNAMIGRLEVSLAAPPTPPAEEEPAPKHPRTTVTQAEPAATETLPSPSPAPAPDTHASNNHAPAPAAPTPPPLPTGTDLADPKNFGMMPPVADLERGNTSEDEYRQRLSHHIAFATQVLHTSRVPAAVWREWRVFEKAARERLREMSVRPADFSAEE